ncbi:EAL domain-containing protein [Pantoea sp. 1.19]|uniref:EAL domain-containing protein n=1 Tax=Pantoea sp. 1.19 TaxID=1925589 RepID=UPI0009489591|nr:EAL domain-containing protein [Pantoea sp. 1.19]
MHMSQQMVGQFRRRRLVVAAIVAGIVLILTLTVGVIREENHIEQQAQAFARSAVTRFDKLFSPLDISASNALGLVGLSCDAVRQPLIEKLAILQTVRAILLVSENTLYCSSIFGARAQSFSQRYPELAVNNQHMLLTTDTLLLKGSPILLLWTPQSTDNRAGILQAINIEMIASYLLEPSQPWVERAVFSVGGKSLEYGNPLIEPTQAADGEVTYVESSLRYPYTITLYGPSPTALALSRLPSQLPLALLLSLLTAYIIWLATATRMSFSWQIGYGISAREFHVWCQPLINARSGDCYGIELLLRWRTERQGWIPPDVFIPIAERQNLIAPLTRYVLSDVVAHLPLLPRQPNFVIAINVAASHFHQQAILDDLDALWWPAHPVPQLVVELTERDALPAVDQQAVTCLQRRGVKVAIDDFGTGHSSLAYLKTLNPDVLKIDKVFTAAIGTDAINATVTDMVIALAQRLDIRLVAEGVETAEQADYLRDRGVDVFQGYYFARPMPLEAFAGWLQHHRQTVAEQTVAEQAA